MSREKPIVKIRGAAIDVLKAGYECDVKLERPQVKGRRELLREKVKAAKRPKASTKESLKLEPSIELVEGYGSKVRQARERLGLSHEELGRRIGEKASVLKRVEAERLVPDQGLTVKLEHVLRIKLLVPISEPKVQLTSMHQPRKATLGEVALINSREAKDKGEI